MGLNPYEVYVKALLEGHEELREKRYRGLWHVSDVLADLEEAIELADLNEKQQLMIRLYYEEQLEQHEMSEQYGLTQSTISYHLRTAIKKIANIYEQWEALEHVDETI